MPKKASYVVILIDKYTKIADKVAERTTRMRVALKKNSDVTKVASKNWKKSTGILKTFSNTAKNAASRMNVLNSSMGSFFARAAPGLLALKALQVSGANTVMEKSFQVMTGSKAIGTSLNLKLQDFAANTHYTIPQIQKTAKTLMAYGFDESDVLKNVETVGAISAGSGADIGRIALAWGQITSTGFLQGQDARQLESAGVGIRKLVQEKVKELHGIDMPMGDIMKAVSNRQIPSAFVGAILEDLTEKGGRFYNILAEINDTLPGQWSNLTDNFIRLGIVWGDGLDATFQIKENLKAANLYMRGLISELQNDPVKMASFQKKAAIGTAAVITMPIIASIMAAASLMGGSVMSLFSAGGLTAIGVVIYSAGAFLLTLLAITAIFVGLFVVPYVYFDEIKSFFTELMKYVVNIPWLFRQAWADSFNFIAKKWNALVDMMPREALGVLGLNIFGPNSMGLPVNSSYMTPSTDRYKLNLILTDQYGNIIDETDIDPSESGGELGNGTGGMDSGLAPNGKKWPTLKTFNGLGALF
tara:strand:+ start:4625 stop:6214 length:1590 start_codon:yes stop_codon:yes gene_type:complete